jgi:ornithine decarboxylase
MTVYDYFVVTCSTLRFGSKPKNIVTCKHTKTYPSTVFGPTCDSTDIILKEYLLPELEMDDWLVFSNMGAYTTSCATNFNGFSSSAKNIYIAYSS